MGQKSLGQLKFTLGFYGTILILFCITTIILNPGKSTVLNLLLFSISVFIAIPVMAKFIDTTIHFVILKRQLASANQLPAWVP